MATNSGVCHNDPNFAVICSFLDRYCEHLALPSISYAELESWLEETKRVNPNLRDLHIRMLRRTSKKCSNVTAERWEKALVKFCHKYSTVDAWELERLSYKYCKISTKLRLLKNLLECQFDTNMKFKDKINEMLPEDMRVLPVGRDKHGLAYWYMLDKSLNLRIYRESLDDVDSETWELVCSDRDDLAKLIENLEKGDHHKLEKSDLSDASYKSEPVSDFNEDSKDSFTRSRSCTPIKPSPLTIKPEPHEEDENESVDEQKSERLTMKLKIPKIESDSPSKRLKDKFEKEKGHEIKKKCKLKYEEDEEHEKSNETDEKEQDSLIETVEEDKITSKTEEVTNQSNDKDEKSEGENHKTENEKSEGENDKTENEKSEGENDNTERKGDEIDGIIDNKKDAEVLNVKDIVNESKGLTSDTDKESVKADGTEELKQTDKDSKDTNTVSDADKNDEITSVKKDELTSENIEQCQKESDKTSKFENETDKIISSDSTKSDDTSAIIVDKSSNRTEIKLTDAGCDNTLSKDDKELSETKSDTATETQDNGILSIDDHDKESESNDVQVESNDKQSESPTTESKTSTNEECKTDDNSDVIQKEETNSENKAENSQVDDKDDVKHENVESPEGKSKEADTDARTRVQKTSDDEEGKASEAIVSNESQKNESLSKISESKVGEKTAEQKLDLACANETRTEDSNSADVKADDIEKPANKSGVLKTLDTDEIQSTKQSKEILSDNVEKSKEQSEKNDLDNVEKSEEEIAKNETDQDKSEKESVSTKKCEQPTIDNAMKKADDDFSKQRGNFMGAFEKFLNPNADTKDSKIEQAKDKVLGSKVDSKGAGDASESSKQEETTETATSKRQTKVAVRKLTKKKTQEDPETPDDNKDDKSENDSSSDSSDEDSSTSITSDDVPLTKMKGLLAHSRLNRGKAIKRQAEESPDESPVEPVSKRSRVRGHVTSKTRNKRQPQVSDSSDSSSASDSDDVPLSQMSRKERKAPPRKQTRPEPSKKSSKQKKKHPSDEDFKSKAVKSKGGKPKEIKPPVDLDPSSNLSEEDTGIRRSARVRSLRSRKKKEPSPVFVPSEIEDLLDDSETDDEFVVKSKRKKKKLIEFEEEVPKGRNAQRLEAKAKSTNKSKKPIKEEEEEKEEDDDAACCKCLKSNHPEWILLCDKCDAGYHTACLRPPLMMIPDGDWFCPPCEHGMLIAKLQENLQTLDTTLLKSDRLVRRKERLAFVGISLDNIIKEEERHDDDVEENSDADSESRSSKSSNSDGSEKSSSESSDSSESSESQSRYPRRERARLERRQERKARRRERKEEIRQSFIKRSCRSKNPISYKFEEYDELIMDAIQEDMSIPKEPRPKKVKPPGISRGKDMSNILGVSDEEEKKTKKPRKRRPRLTELDETDEGEDDTDDYHVSLESSATEVSAESEGVVESGSDFSDDMYNRRRRSRRGSRRTRKSGRKRRGCSRYDDFVVESEYESEDDTGRRSTRRKSARRPVNYREFNSDESEVKADEDDSFHTSDVGSDVGKKKKSRSEKDKKKRKHDESSEDWSEESDSDGKPSSKKKERKPSRKKKYDSGESDSYSEDSESEDRPTRKTAKKGKKNEELEKSESGEEENVKAKTKGKRKAVIESDSENESKGQEENVEKDEQENEISEVNEEVNEKKVMEEKVNEGEKKEIENLIDEGSETEVSEGDWEEVDINSGSEKGGKMKSPKRKASPARGGTSPKKGASAPKKESPAKKGTAAKKGGGSPKKISTSPKKGGKKGSASPEKAITSPVLSSEEIAETVQKEGENVGEESVTDGSEQVPAKPKAARKPRAPAKPRAAGKNTRKRKSTDTSSDNVSKDPEIKPESESAIPATVSEATENAEKETENIGDTSLNSIEPSVSDTSSLNLSHTDDLNKSEEQPDLGSGPELNDSKQELTPEGIPMKRKRTRRTKAQMEIFKKEEEVEIQKMIAQGIPEDVARRRRKSMHKRASLLRSRSQSLEQAPSIGGMPEPIDFLSDENVGVHIQGNAPRSEGDPSVNIASDIQNRRLSDQQMKPNETAMTNVNNEENPVDKTTTENIKVESESDNAVKKDGEKVGDTKVYDEKRDDSPLSARRDYNNAPVGIVKPEVRQGVIVENRQVMDNIRTPAGPSGRAPGPGMVSPLQGMKEMTMGKVGEQGGSQPPNMPPGYQNRGNTEGFRQPQPNYPGFQPQQGPYGPSQQQPYQQGAPHRPYPYGDQQGPMSPTNYPPNSQYMSPNMPPGPQGYYLGPYRGPMGPGMEGPQSPPTGYSGYGPPGSQNFPPQGPYSQGFQPPTGPYQGQMQGPSPQGPMQGPHPGPSGPMNYPPNMQGGYPHAPQPHYPTPHSMQYPQNAPPISPNQPIRPQAIPASHPSPAQPDNQNVRPPMAGVPPRNRRGFMMDNILKPSSSSSGSQDGEPVDEINDIVNYVANDEYFKEH